MSLQVIASLCKSNLKFSDNPSTMDYANRKVWYKIKLIKRNMQLVACTTVYRIYKKKNEPLVHK